MHYGMYQNSYEVPRTLLHLSQILPEQDPAPLRFGLICSGTYLPIRYLSWHETFTFCNVLI